MKNNTNTIVVFIFAILIVILVSTTMGSSYVPFQFGTSTLPQFPYEGFRSRLEYTTYPNNSTIDLMDNKLIVDQHGEKIKVKGFDGLLPSPNSSDASIDTYSQASSNNTCKSYGYTNSRGFLCLNDEQVRLLTTRGGNMSSGDSAIGV
jgi:hypothetical protein